MTIYRVRPGDTIASVACRHAILPTALAAENGLAVDAPLIEGQALLVSPASRTYHTKEGDTLAGIARHRGISLARLRQLNPTLDGENALYPGMTLTLEKATPPRGTLAVTGVAASNTPPEALRPVLPYLTFLAVAACRVDGEGRLSPPEDGAVVAAARAAGVVPLLILRAEGATGGEEAAVCRALFSEPRRWERMMEALAALLCRRGYGGIFLDLPFLSPENADAFLRLLICLRRRLGHSLLVTVNHTPKNGKEEALPPLPLASLGRAAGALSLATYDFPTGHGVPAPHAPYGRVKEAAEAAACDVRPQKLFLGISTKAYDYPLEGGAPTVLPAADIPSLAGAAGRTIGYDPAAHLPYLSYQGQEGERILFFEDAWSLWEKLLLVDDLNLGGVTLYPAVNVATPLLLTLASAFRIVKCHGE